MFENLLKYIKKCSNIKLRNFERAFNTTDTGGVHMNDADCKKQNNIKIIVELLEKSQPEKVAEILEFVKSYLA